MKIALDISQIIYDGSGVASYTTNLVKSLLRYDRQNRYLLFGISFRQLSKLEEFYQDCRKINNKVVSKFYRVPQTVFNFIGNNIHYPDITKLIGPVDIFHSSDWIQPRVSTKKVTTVHDLVILKYPQLSDPYIVKTHKRRLHWVKNECNLVVADSLSTKSDLIQLLDFDSAKVKVVYPAADEYFQKSSDDNIRLVKNKYGLTDNYILAVGTIEPRKNLTRVIFAYGKFLQNRLIKSSIKKTQLVIAGKTGWDKTIKPGKNIKLLGLVTSVDLMALYNGASIFLYPSLYEGFGLPVLEAMKCGCPVICSNRGSLEEIAGDAALIVDPEDVTDIAEKMAELFLDRNQRLNLSHKAKIQSAKFSWKITVRNMLGIYRKL